MSHPFVPARRTRSLTADLVQSLGDSIRDGRLQPGIKLPREADLMQEYGVSRTVVREAISRLQAAGMVETRHGIGTFVVGLGDATTFRIAPDQLGTLNDVIAVLELRIAVESEAAALAAARRGEEHLRAMRTALNAFAAAVEEGRDAVGPDFQFHLEIARAISAFLTANSAETSDSFAANRLRRVNAEHESVFNAIANRDADSARAAMRTHLVNSRERRRRAAVGP